MDLSKIGIGKKVPEEINVIIEVPMGAAPVKYEMDKDSGAIVVDRFVQTSMHYPCNYGFIPHTLSLDGDPADVLVVSRYPLVPGCVIACRPVGVLLMEDDGGKDEKIIAVPTTKLDVFYENIKEHTDITATFVAQIQHFFEQYKAIEKGKWVKILGWGNKARAIELIEASIAEYKKAA
jgi:inorganic pyrophosphatase